MPVRLRELLLFVAAVVVMLFANGRFASVPAAWLGPLLLVRFVRTTTLRNAWIGGVAILWAASFVWWRGVFPVKGAGYVFASLILALATFVPYLLDRRYGKRFGGTFVLPCAAVAIETANSFFSPFGSWGSYAYAQAGFTPLMQLASVTGLAGITFLVLWLAAAQQNRRALIACLGVIACVLVVGAMRVRSASGETVRIATITPRVPTYTAARMKAARDPRVQRAIDDELLAASDTGAELVVWSEGAGIVDAAGEQALIAKAAGLAQRRKIWIQIAYLVLLPKDYANRAVLIDDSGRTVSTYDKAHPVPMMEACAPGDGDLPIATTPFGRVATAICFDGDFPRFMRRAAGADILLLPADDWREVAQIHTDMVRFRAVEQGFSIVRATGNGFSSVVDRFGRVRASADYFSGARAMRADVPRAGQPTLYARYGDAAALLAMALLFVVIAAAEWPVAAAAVESRA